MQNVAAAFEHKIVLVVFYLRVLNLRGPQIYIQTSLTSETISVPETTLLKVGRILFKDSLQDKKRLNRNGRVLNKEQTYKPHPVHRCSNQSDYMRDEI